ncbi:hypothetical protein RIR_jg3220.t1 [Rhizophagus irregularis DAOM 181602=DAOM 197198]|nr:hypothetical protein RIR_jg3220.t1 [Rhizophagus irregularis DAOM 181602=DAOM 197198]
MGIPSNQTRKISANEKYEKNRKPNLDSSTKKYGKNRKPNLDSSTKCRCRNIKSLNEHPEKLLISHNEVVMISKNIVSVSNVQFCGDSVGYIVLYHQHRVNPETQVLLKGQ